MRWFFIVLSLGIGVVCSCLGVADTEGTTGVDGQVSFRPGDAWEYWFRVYSDTLDTYDTLSGKLTVTVLDEKEILAGDTLMVFKMATVFDQDGFLVKDGDSLQTVVAGDLYTFELYMKETDSFYVSRGYTPTGVAQTPLLKAKVEPSETKNRNNQKTYLEEELVNSFPRFLYPGNTWKQRPGFYTMEINLKEDISLTQSDNQRISGYQVEARPSISVALKDRFAYFYWIDSLGVIGGEISKEKYYFDFERTNWSYGNDSFLDPRD